MLYIFAGYIISHFEVNKTFLYCVFEYFIPLILTLVPLDCQTTYKNLKFVVIMELIDKNQQLRKGHVRHVYFNLFALKTIQDILQKHFLHCCTYTSLKFATFLFFFFGITGWRLFIDSAGILSSILQSQYFLIGEKYAPIIAWPIRE